MIGNITLVMSVFSTASRATKNLETATFAGGCFWCMEHPFEEMNGVVKVLPGYTGGFTENPTYSEVCSGSTGHLEAVQIQFDPSRITYETLLDVFWRQIDPTDEGGQFADRGTQYGTAVFYHSDEQRQKAEASRTQLDRSGTFKKKIVTEVVKAQEFYPAEEYHQNYYKKCPLPYQRYRNGSGRDAYLNRVWKDDRTVQPQQKASPHQNYEKLSPQAVRERLTPLQYRVTQENGTERAFSNELWDNKQDGIYVDLLSGEPLFSSSDKFDSGTGWPSFTKPLVADNIQELEDRKLFMKRTEVRSRHADSHLGHVFDDGPDPTGQRYCINSAALRFVPRDKLAEEGYEDYLVLFEPGD